MGGNDPVDHTYHRTELYVQHQSILLPLKVLDPAIISAVLVERICLVIREEAL